MPGRISTHYGVNNMADRSKVPIARIDGLDEKLKKVSGFDFEGTKAEFDAAVSGDTVAEQVQALESETGLTRVMRELVLAENSGASDYVRGKAQEIETLAQGLRADTETEKTAE